MTDSHLPINSTKESSNDISLNRLNGSSNTSENTKDPLSQLARTTVHCERTLGVEARNAEEQAKSEFCGVCGDTAGTHFYYGGKSCKSCRQFFRRSVHAFRRPVHNYIFKYMLVFLNIHSYMTF